MNTTPSSSETIAAFGTAAPVESILDKRARLEREVEALHEQMRAMDQDVKQERLLAGLRAVGAAGGWFDAEYCHENCLSGILTGSDTNHDGFKLQKHFGFDGYHETLHLDNPSFLPGVNVLSVSANDGKLDLHIGLDNPHAGESIRVQLKLPPTEVLNTIKRFLSELGIFLKATRLRCKRFAAQKEADELTQSIAAVEAPIS